MSLSEPVYLTGHIKHNPSTNEVALRTVFGPNAGRPPGTMTWLVSTTNAGARNTNSDEVAGWADLYDPSAP